MTSMLKSEGVSDIAAVNNSGNVPKVYEYTYLFFA